MSLLRILGNMRSKKSLEIDSRRERYTVDYRSTSSRWLFGGSETVHANVHTVCGERGRHTGAGPYTFGAFRDTRWSEKQLQFKEAEEAKKDRIIFLGGTGSRGWQQVAIPILTEKRLWIGKRSSNVITRMRRSRYFQ